MISKKTNARYTFDPLDLTSEIFPITPSALVKWNPPLLQGYDKSQSDNQTLYTTSEISDSENLLILDPDDFNIVSFVSGDPTVVNGDSAFGDTSLVLKMPFNYSLNSTVNGYTGNFSDPNVPLFSENGKLSGCLAFDGTHYVTTNFTMQDWSAYTISIWFKRDGTPSGDEGVFCDLDSGFDYTAARALIAFHDQYFIANMGDDNAYWQDSTVDVSELFDNQWHHICLVVDNTTMKLYIDATLKNTYTMDIAAGTAGTNSYVIGQLGTGGGFTTGSVDHLSIYNRAISDSEVQTLYNESDVYYQIDISLLGFSKAPDFVFRNNPISVTYKVADTIENLGTATEKNLSETSRVFHFSTGKFISVFETRDTFDSTTPILQYILESTAADTEVVEFFHQEKVRS